MLLHEARRLRLHLGITEALNNPVSDIVTKIEIPVSFIMGKFENSAHYPQFEEEERFFEWMYSMYVK